MSDPDPCPAGRVPSPPGPPVVEIPRVPEHSRLYRFLQHPFLYVVLFGLWFACDQWGWLPMQRLPEPSPRTTVRETHSSPHTFAELLHELFPETQNGRSARRGGLLGLAITAAPLLLGGMLFLSYLVLRALRVRLLPAVRFRAPWWGTWHLARVAIVFLVVARLVSAAMVAVRQWASAPAARALLPDHVLAVLGAGLMFLCTCGFLFLLVTVGGGHPLRALGLVERRPVHRAVIGVVALLTALPLIVLATLFMRALWMQLGKEPGLQGVLESARTMGSGAFLIVVFAGVVVAPLTEEILFRGFLYGTLRRYAGAFGSIVVSALAFALLHEPITFLPIFVIGCLLAYLYERTGSIVAPIAAHAANNLYTFVLLYVHYR